MDIFKNNGFKKSKDNSRKTEVHAGTYEDMIKTKAKQLPGIQKAIQELFEDYDGGGVAIVMNTYDENGDVEGAKVAILGLDKPAGLMRLAKAVHMASEEIVDNIQDTHDPAMLMEAAMEMLSDIVNRHKEGKK